MKAERQHMPPGGRHRQPRALLQQLLQTLICCDVCSRLASSRNCGGGQAQRGREVEAHVPEQLLRSAHGGADVPEGGLRGNGGFMFLTAQTLQIFHAGRASKQLDELVSLCVDGAYMLGAHLHLILNQLFEAQALGLGRGCGAGSSPW